MKPRHDEARLPDWLAARSASGPAPASLARRVIAGVMRNAQAGDLPLFTWTLGLPQERLMSAIAAYFPELGALDSMPAQEYAILLRGVPALFDDLLAFLLVQAPAAGLSGLQHECLARALAAAALGERHYWQDAGLSSRAEMSLLLAQHFPDLHARNVDNLKWKRFLFRELGQALGQPELQPPGCSRCDQFATCFHSSKGKD